DARGTKLQPFVSGGMASRESIRSPDSLVFRPRSMKCPQLFHRKRCAPSRAECLHQSAKMQNCNALTVQSNPTPSVPPQRDYAQGKRESLHSLVPALMSPYGSAPLLVRSLVPSSREKKPSLRNATRIAPDS